MKVFDVFPFFNELDILEIRLNILDPYVDFFILSESTKTFSGLNKPLFYQENKKKFEKFNHKIIHNIIDKDASTEELLNYGKKYNNNVEAQQRDIYQKDSIKNIILENCNQDDIVLWGDADEIPNPIVIENISDFFEPETIYHLAQENCLGYLNLVEVGGIISGMTRDFLPDDDGVKKWLGTKIIDYSILQKYTLTQLRNYIPESKNSRISSGGWHWSYVGSDGLSVEERILKKVECAAHVEYNNENVKSHISSVNENKDPFGRNYASYKVVPIDDSYPNYIIKNKEKYSYLIKDN
jgi:beta-1,4-mannosyl-glycoprotein beta-1,4-N-acetylglucosaminyltransferase